MIKYHYTSSPLPFQGQKRNFLNEFKELLTHYPSDATYLDLFGGSGLLSHTVKQVYPEAKVVYNDFDNYSERLKNIEKTNALASDLNDILKDIPRSQKLDESSKQKVFYRIKQEDYKDWITLSSRLLFGGRYEKDDRFFNQNTFYNGTLKANYTYKGYLEGVEVACFDYKKLIEQYKDQAKVVYIVDPPYLYCDLKAYKKDAWKLKDQLMLLKEVIQMKQLIYFTCNRSEVIELCHWLGEIDPKLDPFWGVSKKSRTNGLSYSASYVDYMIYRYH